MAEYNLDMADKDCPIPVIETTKKMKELDAGDMLVVKVGSSCAMKTVPDWARENNHEVEVEEIGDELWNVYIQKN